MGDLIEIWFFMLIIACAAFAPLGYFIYKYSQNNAKPFGETEPHGDSPSLVNEFAEKVIALFKNVVMNK
jgi:hypothetical protein